MKCSQTCCCLLPFGITSKAVKTSPSTALPVRTSFSIFGISVEILFHSNWISYISKNMTCIPCAVSHILCYCIDSCDTMSCWVHIIIWCIQYLDFWCSPGKITSLGSDSTRFPATPSSRIGVYLMIRFLIKPKGCRFHWYHDCKVDTSQYYMLAKHL